MSEPNSKDEDLAIVRRHIEQLLEHFDTVQIFCTRYNPNKVDEDTGEGSTTHVNTGSGNWFARYGLVEYWLNENRPHPKGEDL